MVRSYLVESRICYKSDGVSAAERARESATPAETNDSGRPLVRGTTNVVDNSRQILPPSSQILPPSSQVEEGRGSTTSSPPPTTSFQAQGQTAQNTIDEARQQEKQKNYDQVMAAALAFSQRGEDFSGVGQNFIDNALKPNPADQIASNTMLGQLLGADSAEDAAKRRVSDMLNSGAVFNQENRRFELPTGSGMLSMGENGNVIYQGPSDDTYRGPFADKVNFDSDPNAADPSYYQMQEASRNQQAQLDPGTTTPEQIDDLAINYLQNPYYLYGGSGNLFQPYGYAGGTLVDLLQTRNMAMPDQAAPNLNLFGNPRDFT